MPKNGKKVFELSVERPDGCVSLLPQQRVATVETRRGLAREVRVALQWMSSRTAQFLLYTAKTKRETKLHNQV